MKRMRQRYVLLSFSSQLTSHKEVADEVSEALRSQGIGAWAVHSGPGTLIYRCSNRSIDEFRGLFPLVLTDNARIDIRGVSGTLKALKRNFMS